VPTLVTPDIPLPRHDRSVVAVAAPGEGPGHWAGGPSAVLAEGDWWLAYRLRRPVGEGRGYAVTIARSPDGEAFTPAATLERDAFGAASLERPALVRRPDGGWRIYISCSTPGSDHWWVDALDADDPGSFDPAARTPVFPGDDGTAMKDPVVWCDDEGWHAWVCCHPLDDAGDTDRMTSRRATSDDGLRWRFTGDELAGAAGAWDQRGARVTSVVPGTGALFYDGRADADENWEERTGLAVPGSGGGLVRPDDGPVAVSPHASGALRYLCVVALPDGGHRLFYEAATADGAHDVRTELVLPAD